MKRTALTKLVEWKQKKDRKPLIIRGARQVGKTWLMKEFARLEYKNCAYINFESSPHLKNLFLTNFDIKRILTAISIEVGFIPDEQDTLIILDEIQEAEGGLTALKYFNENAPQYHVMAAGSLLGVALSRGTSFPVGKVDFLDLYPLSFIEFLEATGEQSLVKLLVIADWQTITIFKDKFTERLKQYYFVGGMPEVVDSFIKELNYSKIRNLQENLLKAYEQDFSKYASHRIVPRIRMLWYSIPSQLAKENRKFIYGLIKQGARAKEYEEAINWLSDCGLLHKVHVVNKPAVPLKAYEDLKSFKLYIVDVGLLGAMAGLDAKTLLHGNELFTEFKGALTEQFVLQQLLLQNTGSINYWATQNSRAEVDFVIQCQEHVIPIEVKSEENLQAKSLKVYQDKFNPSVTIRVSMANYRKESTLINLPLYAVNSLTQLINANQ